MKYGIRLVGALAVKSPPARGAWIEMPPEDEGELMKMSPPARGAWIEISRRSSDYACYACRPPHGGRGLKCSCQKAVSVPRRVAPRTGGVD